MSSLSFERDGFCWSVLRESLPWNGSRGWRSRTLWTWSSEAEWHQPSVWRTGTLTSWSYSSLDSSVPPSSSWQVMMTDTSDPFLLLISCWLTEGDWVSGPECSRLMVIYLKTFNYWHYELEVHCTYRPTRHYSPQCDTASPTSPG